MSPFFIIGLIVVYFLILVLISWLTSRNADNDTFFIGNRKSPWFLVAFGMIGASLSGVTFISIPGWVGESQFSYLQMVFGYLVGYAVIANILMPVYYKLQLTSIYTYLEQRFGFWSYKTGSAFFLLSRFVGASFRLFLSASVLQIVLFDKIGIPFWLTTVLIIFFIWLFTFRGGIKTVIWTDTIQTAFMLASLIICIVLISQKLNLSFAGLADTLYHSSYSKIFFFSDWFDKRHFFKQFFSGMLITIVMTGLDQDLMQKNLSCKNIKEAKKNMFWFSLTLVPVNIIFLSLGAMLYIFALKTGFPMPHRSDDLFPLIATQSFMPAAFLAIFTIGLVSTTYSSADSALTSLTTSFTIDILQIKNKSDKEITRIRQTVHLLFAGVIVLLILLFRMINNESVVSAVFTAAGYTYGPLLGLYAFGFFTQYQLHDRYVPWIAILSPLLTFAINYILIRIFSFDLGFLVLALNGMITLTGLFLIRKKEI
jgi:solute:Na+ symporter, SSS family